MITVEQITRGLYAGRWAWAVQAPPRPVNPYRMAVRRGIALDEITARKTAHRMARYHQTREDRT